MFKQILNYKNLLNEFFWVLSGNLFNIIGLLGVTKILAFYLPQSSFGLYYIGSTLSIFATQIFYGPFGNGFSRFFCIADEGNQLDLFLNQALKMIRYLTILFITGSILLYFFIYRVYQIQPTQFLSFLGIAVFSSYSALVYAYFHLVRERLKIAFFQGLDAFIKVALLLVTAIYCQSNIESFLYVLVASSFLILVFQIFHLKSSGIFTTHINVSINGSWTKNIFLFSYPFAIWGVFTWLQMSADRYFLGFFWSPQRVAEYAIIFQLGYYPPSILIGNFVQTVTPVLYKIAGAGKDYTSVKRSSNMIIKMTLYSLFMVIIGFLIMFLFSNTIIVLLADSKYISIASYLPYMFLSGGIFSTAQILSIDFQSKMRIKTLMWIKILTSVIGIIFSFFSILYFGLLGAIINCVLFSVLYLLSLIYFRKL
jgi:O-antigen/teichoic acid export membrane protein